MNKRSKILLIATALATIYVVYLISYFYGGTINAGDTAEAVGGAIATAFVTPHMIMFLTYQFPTVSHILI